MNLTYEKYGDYLIPNIITDPEQEGELRKFGLMRKHYLKEYKRGIYQGMVLSGKLKYICSWCRNGQNHSLKSWQSRWQKKFYEKRCYGDCCMTFQKAGLVNQTSVGHIY